MAQSRGRLLLLLALISFVRTKADNNMEHRFEEIDEQLQEISDKVAENSHRIDEILRSSSTGEVERPLETDTSQREVERVTAGQEEVVSPVTVYQLSREPLDNGMVRYAVRFVKNVDVVRYRCVDVPNTLVEPELSVLRGDMEEISVTVNETRKETLPDYDRVQFLFYDDEMTSGVTLALGKPLENGLVVAPADDFVIPTLTLDPPRELVYEEGHDSDIRVTIGEDDEGISFMYNTYTHPYLYDLDKEEFLKNSEALENMTEIVKDEIIEGGMEYDVRIKTSQRKICGFVEVSHFGYSKNALLKFVLVHRMLQIRPLTQDQAFPDRAIGFLTPSHSSFHTCEIKEGFNCTAECIVAGGDVADFRVQERSPYGISMPLVPDNEIENRYIKDYSYSFTPPPINQIKNFKRFLCSAITSDGVRLQKEMEIMYKMEPKIYENETSYQFSEEGNLKKVELECVASGLPLPNISFHLHFSNDSSYDFEPDRTVIFPNESKVSAFKTVVWDPELSSSWTDNDLDLAICNTYSSRYFRSISKEIFNSSPDTLLDYWFNG